MRNAMNAMEHEATWSVHAAHVHEDIAKGIRAAEILAQIEQSRGLDATRHLRESHQVEPKP